MQRRTLLLIFWFFGFLCGAILIIFLREGHDQLVDIDIQNKSGKTIEKIIISDDVLHNNYLIETIPNNAETAVSIFARGEIGYTVNVYFEDSKKIFYDVYAKTGYNDRFIIRSDSVEYFSGVTY